MNVVLAGVRGSLIWPTLFVHKNTKAFLARNFIEKKNKYEIMNTMIMAILDA